MERSGASEKRNEREKSVNKRQIKRPIKRWKGSTE